jgi:7,8-dihydropterin-6-yl-methyl-4-(beta-D-ribofuranosyl)aminobenzene 5'-phosphate synthase
MLAYNEKAIYRMDDNMKITALVENTTNDKTFSCEHGLSLYIETKNHKILFDTGQSSLFYENAKKLNIDISDVDICILSHGHYDHGGGLSTFLSANEKAKIYMNENCFGDYYNGEKYIGLDKALFDNPRIVKTSDELIIDNELSLFTCNKKQKDYDLGSFGLSKKTGDSIADDDFLHEHYLLINEDGNKVLISGCSHKGILNIPHWFDAKTVIGGFHFSKLPCDETLKSYAEILDNTGITFYTCHCTGLEQYEYMKQYMKNLHYISTAETLLI